MNQFFTPYQDYPVAFIAELVTLLPILIGLFRIRTFQYEIRFLVILFVLFFFRDIYSNVLASTKENNLFLYNLFSFFELAFIALIFYSNSKIRSKRYRKIILWGVLVSLVSNIYFYTEKDFSIGSFTIVRVYGILVTMTFFERVLSELTIRNILAYSMFWINSGLLLYFCGTFFIFLLSDKVLSSKTKPDIFQQYWDTNLIFYIFFCLLASTGIWLSKYDKENLI